jgi:hypothetical protein
MMIPENEKIINYFVVLNKAGRQFSLLDGNRWGGLILPDPGENPGKTQGGLKVVVFASWKFGYIVLETLKNYETRFPGNLNLVGLVTDNPLNPDAKISKKKRVWHYLDLPYQVINEAWILESGLTHGMPVYTGEVKIDSFRKLLKQWNPDAILVCVFGQILDSAIIEFPAYGIYNFHPSDLTRNEGAGPAPYEDLVARKASTTVWSIHQVTNEVDKGHVVGISPPVNVLNTNRVIPEDPLIVYDKLAEMLSPVVYCLIDEICARYGKKQTGFVDTIDFGQRISSEVRHRNMQPINRDQPKKYPRNQAISSDSR